MWGAIAEAFGTAAQIDGQRSRDTANYFINKESASDQYQRSKKLMALQMANELQLARDMPSARMEGLRSAGLNPILAAGGNFGGGSASMAQASKADSLGGGSGVSSNIGAALNSGQAIKNLKELQDKQAEKLDADIRLTNEQALTQKDQQAYLQAQADTERNRPENIRSQTDLNKKDAELKHWQAIMQKLPAEFYEKYPHLLALRESGITGLSLKSYQDVVQTVFDWLHEWDQNRNDDSNSAKDKNSKPKTNKTTPWWNFNLKVF